MNVFLRYKKISFFILVFILFLAITSGIWLWRSVAEKKALNQQLEEVEQQIKATKEQIEKLEKLTPEEAEKVEKEREILSAQSVNNDVEVEGVEITKLINKKTVKNTSQGYSIELPSNLLLARSISSDLLEFHDQKFMCIEPSCEPALRVTVTEANIDEILDPYPSYETLTINEEVVYRVTEQIPRVFEGFYYFWSKGNKIFSLRISSFDEPTYRTYIETFKLE